MKSSNAATVVGGGEMKRATCSVVSSAFNEAASPSCSSRSVTPVPRSTGSLARQMAAGAIHVVELPDVNSGLIGHYFHRRTASGLATTSQFIGHYGRAQ